MNDFRTDYTPNGFKKKPLSKSEESWPLRLVDLLIIILTTALVFWLLCFAGPSLDAHAGEYHESQALVDAQRAAVMAFKKDMAAAKLCRQSHPGSLVRWTVDGELVCVPQNQIASK